MCIIMDELRCVKNTVKVYQHIKKQKIKNRRKKKKLKQNHNKENTTKHGGVQC